MNKTPAPVAPEVVGPSEFVRNSQSAVIERTTKEFRSIAHSVRLSASLCGSSAEGASWDGWVYEHPLFGEGERPYVSEIDCLEDGLLQLHSALESELGL